jgi:regulatory protein
MTSEDERQQALVRAYRLLAIRSRSEQEMRRSLGRADFGEAAIEEAISELHRRGLLNDGEFASEWAESRMHSRPRGRRLIEHELRTRGVEEEHVAAATSGIDDDTTALELAKRRARLMQGLDRQTFVRRLSNYLRARGFSGETISRAVTAVLSVGDDS